MDMSEALFNELAFFKLMEGLGEPASYSGEDEYCSSATQVSSLISSILYLSNIIEVWRGMPINRYQYCSCNTRFDLTAIINISLSQTLAYDDESGMQHLVQTDESDTTETVTDEEEETLNSSVRVNDREEEEEELGKVNPPPISPHTQPCPTQPYPTQSGHITH